MADFKLSKRENFMKFMNHEIPERLIDGWEDMWFTIPPELRERGTGGEEALGGSGYDGFGVHWSYVETVQAATPSPSDQYPPVMTDITKWREQVKFPDPL